MITHASRFRPNEREVSHDTIDGEVILIHLRSGIYYSIEKIGAWIWSCIVEGAAFGEILSSLNNVYSEKDSLEEGVSDFMNHLLQEELIVEQDLVDNGLSLTPALAVTEFESSSKFEPPKLHVYTDMQTLLLLDPIHEVDEAGWPSPQAPEKPIEQNAKKTVQRADTSRQ